MAKNQNLPLKLNVGFIAHQPVGYRQVIRVEEPALHLPPDLELKSFDLKLMVSRNSQGLLVEGQVQAQTPMECVRCLSAVDLQLATQFTELYAFSKRSITESELLLPEDGDIDLGPLVREYMIIEIPISALCKSDCKGLCPICGENRNDHDCQHDTEDIDPRLSSLQSLLKD